LEWGGKGEKKNRIWNEVDWIKKEWVYLNKKFILNIIDVSNLLLIFNLIILY